MRERNVPAWFARAKEIAARTTAPTGQPFSMKKDGKCARLYLYDEIGYDPWFDVGISAADIVKAVQDAAGADTLEVHINSPGGYVFEGIAIFNAIRSFQGEKVVYVDGIAASIASVIALAGDRVITNEGAMWMIHRVSGGIFAMGTADEIEAEAARVVTAIRALDANALDIYVNATGQPREQIEKWLQTDTYMTAQEALDRGFTDEIVKQSAANAMGCECDGTCGSACPCDGNCTADCECDCAERKQKNAAPVVPPRALTQAELVANARAQAAAARALAVSLANRFPGQPGSTPASRAQ